MKSYLLRGVPHSVAMDGWWLSSDRPRPPRPPASGAERAPWHWRAGALLGLIALADVLLWQVVPGISLAVFGMAVLAAAWMLAGRNGAGGLALAALLFLPAVERVQTLSLAFWFAGMALGAAWIGLGRAPGVSAAVRFLVLAPGAVIAEAGEMTRMGRSDLRDGLRAAWIGWFLPLGLGLIFLSLLASANPVVDLWLERLFRLEGPTPISLDRLVFWLGIAMLCAPFLSLARMRHRLGAQRLARSGGYVPHMINAASVRRSLILFNAVFAVQTISDVAILWGGAALPDGMSHASYAHRGAYPLLATALLAGAFALAARPFTSGNWPLRAALLGWMTQTLLLVFSSLTRLESYVSVYGLTHLRLAALIWMGLVALGIVLVIWQIQRDHSASWMLKRCAWLAAGTLYTCSFISFAASVAQYNLNHDVAPDPHYICALDSAALPAIRAHEARIGRPYCPAYLSASFSAPDDWRKWGFRDWRTARSLAAIPSRSEATWPIF